MTIEKAIKELKQTANEFNASFISTEYLRSLMPESANDIYFDELCRLKEVLGHDIACLREFMDLANDKLTSMIMNNDLQIGIISGKF